MDAKTMAFLRSNASGAGSSSPLHPDEWLPLQDAALRAKIPVKSLRKYIREGRIRAFGRPRRLRVRMADVLPPYTPPAPRKGAQGGSTAAVRGNQ